MRTVALVLLAVAACGDSSTTPIDGALADTAAIDTSPPDAPANDAQPIDAIPIDAIPIDAAPLRCVETTERLLDLAPRRLGASALLGSTLYVATYDPDSTGASGEVLAIDMGNLEITPIATGHRVYMLRVVAGWLYAAEGGPHGSVWRYRSGQRLEVLAADRNQPYVVTADDSQVYWREGPFADPMVLRAPLSGGVATPIGAFNAYHLAVDERYLFVGEAIGPVRRLRKDNWFNNWNSSTVLQNAGLVLDDGEVIVADDVGVLRVRPPAAQLSPIAAMPEHRYGLTLAGGYLWVSSSQGVMRVPRTGGAFESVTPIFTDGQPIITGEHLIWTSITALYRCRP